MLAQRPIQCNAVSLRSATVSRQIRRGLELCLEDLSLLHTNPPTDLPHAVGSLTLSPVAACREAHAPSLAQGSSVPPFTLPVAANRSSPHLRLEGMQCRRRRKRFVHLLLLLPPPCHGRHCGAHPEARTRPSPGSSLPDIPRPSAHARRRPAHTRQRRGSEVCLNSDVAVVRIIKMAY
jgi:hypothetical protein